MSVTRFHHRCYRGITLSDNNTTAVHTLGLGTVFSSVPIQQLHNNRFMFKMKRGGVIPPICYIGVTQSNPADLTEIPWDAWHVPQTWCVRPGTGARWENSRQVATGEDTRVTQAEGDVWCVKVTPGGQVYIYHNNRQPCGSPVFTLPPDTTQVWAVVELVHTTISVVQDPDTVYPDHPEHGIDLRTSDYGYVMKRASSDLEDTMNVEDVVKYLCAADILTKGDINDMNNLKRAKKSNRLIEILAGKGKLGLSALRKALEQTGQGNLNEYLPHPSIRTEDINSEFERLMLSDTAEVKSGGVSREIVHRQRLVRVLSIKEGRSLRPFKRVPDPVSSSLFKEQSRMQLDKDQSSDLLSEGNCPACGQSLFDQEEKEPRSKPNTTDDDVSYASPRAGHKDPVHTLFGETREPMIETPPSEAGEIEPQTSPSRINKQARYVKFKLMLDAEKLSAEAQTTILRLIAETLHYKCGKDGQAGGTTDSDRNPLWNILVKVTKSVTEGIGLDLHMRCDSKEDVTYLSMLYITGDLHKILTQTSVRVIKRRWPGEESDRIKFKTEAVADDFKSFLYNLL